MERSIFKVEDVFYIEGVGVIAVGSLTDGVLQAGMKAIINGKQAEVLRIEMKNQVINSLAVGISAGVILKNVEKKDIQIGGEYTFN